MGAQCSFSCGQSLEGKNSEVVDQLQKLKVNTTSAMNVSLDSDESVILDPVGVLTKSLIRRYLIQKYFRTVSLFLSLGAPDIVVYEPPVTAPEIEKIEKSLPLFPGRREVGPIFENFSTVYLNEGGCYLGQWEVSQLKPEGLGVMVSSDYSKYIGGFKSGKKCGKGRLITIEGDIYEGEFYNDKMHGQGKLKRSNGTVYKGMFLNNLEHGEGVLEHLGKVIYKGGYSRGLKHGYGELTLGDNLYIGDFALDHMDGNGTYKWADGKSYSGGWKASKMHGYGTHKLNGGKIYVGYFSEGLREGIGSFKWPEKGEYKGEWSKGKFHGQGTYYYNDKVKQRHITAIYEYGKRIKILSQSSVK